MTDGIGITAVEDDSWKHFWSKVKVKTQRPEPTAGIPREVLYHMAFYDICFKFLLLDGVIWLLVYI